MRDATLDCGCTYTEGVGIRWCKTHQEGPRSGAHVALLQQKNAQREYQALVDKYGEERARKIVITKVRQMGTTRLTTLLATGVDINAT